MMSAAAATKPRPRMVMVRLSARISSRSDEPGRDRYDTRRSREPMLKVTVQAIQGQAGAAGQPKAAMTARFGPPR